MYFGGQLWSVCYYFSFKKEARGRGQQFQFFLFFLCHWKKKKRKKLVLVAMTFLNFFALVHVPHGKFGGMPWHFQ